MRPTLLLVASAVLIAGCASPDRVSDHQPPLGFDLNWHCRERGGSFQFDAAPLQASMPEGFTVVSDLAGATSVSLEIYECEELSFMIGSWPVTPPDSLKRDGIGEYRMSDGGITDSPEFLHTLDVWGFSASFQAGDVRIEEEELGLGRRGTLTASSEEGQVQLDWVLQGQPGALPALERRLFVVDPSTLPFQLTGYYDEARSASSGLLGAGLALMNAGTLQRGEPIYADDVGLSLMHTSQGST